MLRFFRRIRKSLLGSGQTRKYILYALGEVLLVMVGILLALQVNNWNEARKSRANFEFGLKEVYTQIRVNYFDLVASRERINFQLTYIDSLQNHSHLLEPKNIPGIIQLQDYRGKSTDIDQAELFEPFLKLAINDKVQNELAKSLRKNFLITKDLYSDQSYNFEKTKINIQLFDYLRAYNVPLRFMETAPSYSEFIKSPSPDFYDEDHLDAVMSLLEDLSFQADLKTIQYIKQKYLSQLFELENIYTSTLDFLDKNYPNSKDHITKMEIIGSGIEISNWAIGIPMIKTKEGVFEIELDLIPGEIKFRSDQNYTYDWGGSQTDVNALAFKGTNIPVEKGQFKIMIDINEMIYSITQIE